MIYIYHHQDRSPKHISATVSVFLLFLYHLQHIFRVFITCFTTHLHLHLQTRTTNTTVPSAMNYGPQTQMCAKPTTYQPQKPPSCIGPHRLQGQGEERRWRWARDVVFWYVFFLKFFYSTNIHFIWALAMTMDTSCTTRAPTLTTNASWWGHFFIPIYLRFWATRHNLCTM